MVGWLVDWLAQSAVWVDVAFARLLLLQADSSRERSVQHTIQHALCVRSSLVQSAETSLTRPACPRLVDAADSVRRRDFPVSLLREEYAGLLVPAVVMRDGSRLLTGPLSATGTGSAALWRLAMEVKPKWGFLPCSPFLAPLTATAKRTVCRFCMHQQYKRSKGESEDTMHTQRSLPCWSQPL